MTRAGLLTTTAATPVEENAGNAVEQSLDQLLPLEQKDNFLHRATAGVRSATLNKLLFDEAETAIILGVSPETLKLWRREGRGPPWVRLGGSTKRKKRSATAPPKGEPSKHAPGPAAAKLVRYRLADLRKYAAALRHEVDPTPTTKE